MTKDGAPDQSDLELLIETLDGWGQQLKHVDADAILKPVDGSAASINTVPGSEIEPPSCSGPQEPQP